MSASDYEIYQIELRDSRGNSELGTLHLADGDDDSCRLELVFGKRTLTATASDFFEAFCQIRLALEPEGIFPVCYAASKNAYPSGMCRNMGYGLTAYKMTKGQRGRQVDLVNAFDSGDDVLPVTVAEQRAFFEAWLKSFQN